MKRKVAAFIISLIIIYGGKTFAGEKYELGEVVINDIADSSVVGREGTSSLLVIDRKQIESSYAHDVLELISGQVPGVFVTERGFLNYGIGTGSAGKISIRGLGGEPNAEVLVLLDGQPTKTGLFGHPIPDAYPLDEVERIEVLRGPHSLHYGNHAMGGVINIVTKKAPKEGFDTRVDIGLGQDDTYRGSFSHGGRVDNFSYFGSVIHRQSEGDRPNSQFDGENFYGKAGYQIDENWNLTLNGWGVDFTVHDPGTITSPSLTDSRKVTRGGGGVTLFNDFEDSAGALTLFGEWGDHDFANFDGWDSTDRVLGIIGFQSFEVLPDNRLEIGLDVEQCGGRGKNTITGVDFGRHYQWLYGGYIDDEFKLFDKLTIQAGLRGQWGEALDAVAIPRGGVRLEVGESTFLHGQISRGYRAPTVRDLALFSSSNEDLKAEEAWSYELGWEQHLGEKFFFDLTAFYVDAENLIQFDGTTYKFQNTGAVINKGVETQASWHPADFFDMSLSYTALDQSRDITGNAQHVISATTNLRWRDFYLQVVPQYVYRLKLTSRYEDYFVTDLRLGYKPKDWFDLSLIVSNVFDESYETVQGYPMPEQFVMGKLSLKF